MYQKRRRFVRRKSSYRSFVCDNGIEIFSVVLVDDSSLNVKEFKRAGGGIGVRLAVLYLPSRYFNLRDLVVVPVVDSAYDEREKGRMTEGNKER